MVDRNKVLQGLKFCQDDHGKCSICPYYHDCMTIGWFKAMLNDAANLIELQDEMLKQANALLQEALKRCMNKLNGWKGRRNEMINRDDVIKGLTKLHENSGCIDIFGNICETCPYKSINGCCDQIIIDALELIKAMEKVVEPNENQA